MSEIVTPQSYNQQFTKHPIHDLKINNPACWTMITCIHPVHGVDIYYLSLEDFQVNIKGLLTPYWINCYVVTIQPMD